MGASAPPNQPLGSIDFYAERSRKATSLRGPRKAATAERPGLQQSRIVTECTREAVQRREEAFHLRAAVFAVYTPLGQVLTVVANEPVSAFS
jgi:hypothetical protein